MDTLRIDTTQNIDIEQPIASIGERIAATLLDVLFMFAYFIGIAFISGLVQSKAIWIIASIPIALYSLISELVMNGQSWGKKIMKIKVVKSDGTAVTFSGYFLRWITRLFEIYALVGSIATITIILNRKGQRLGDIAANTTVIRVREKSLREIKVMKLPENYTVVYPEVSQLSSADINTIREVLELLKSGNKVESAFVIAEKTRQAIERKLHVQSGQDSVAFFLTIIRDYNFLHSQS